MQRTFKFDSNYYKLRRMPPACTNMQMHARAPLPTTALITQIQHGARGAKPQSKVFPEPGEFQHIKRRTLVREDRPTDELKQQYGAKMVHLSLSRSLSLSLFLPLSLSLARAPSRSLSLSRVRFVHSACMHCVVTSHYGVKRISAYAPFLTSTHVRTHARRTCGCTLTQLPIIDASQMRARCAVY